MKKLCVTEITYVYGSDNQSVIRLSFHVNNNN